MDFRLVRQLIERRIAADADASAMGFSDDLAQLPEPMLAGTPEATIFAIVETWTTMTRAGASRAETSRAIEKYRASQIGGGTGDDPPPHLLAYVMYRLALEHDDTPGLSVDHVKWCIDTIEASSRAEQSGPRGFESGDGEPSIEELMVFTNAPDLKGKRPFDQYKVGQYIIVFFEDLVPIGARLGVPTIVRYVYVAAVLENTFAPPLFWVALESGVTDSAFLCVGSFDGNRENYGPSNEFRDKARFVNRALELAAARLRVSQAPTRFRLPSQQEPGARNGETTNGGVTHRDDSSTDSFPWLIVILGLIALIIFTVYQYVR